MEIDDHDFLLVRKNLNILSVLILILAFTNAKLGSLNLLGIQMDLEGVKLYQALYIGYVYFLWRFFTKLPLRSGFWNDFLQYFMNSEEGVKKKHNFDRYKKEFIDNSDRLKHAYEINDKYLNHVQLSVIRFPDWPLTQLRLSATFQASGREGKNDNAQFGVDHDIKVSRFFVLKKLILFCIKYDKFGDYLFPLIPVLTVLGFFFFKLDWQGSFFSIFIK